MALWGASANANGYTGGGFTRDGAGASPAGTGNVQRSNIKGVLSCTIATILESKYNNEQNCYVYKHLKFNNVCILGIIRSSQSSSAHTTYTLDDHTGGLIDVKAWADDSAEVYVESTYVKVYGCIKQLAGKLMISAFRINRLKSVNELTSHLVECVHASIYHQKQQGGSTGVNGTTMTTMSSNGASNARNGNTGGGGVPTSNTGFSNLENGIVNYLKSSQTNTGFSVKDICQRLKQFNEQQIR
ncbi:unnamed protein product, partial [Didymodactylos carnosus]